MASIYIGLSYHISCAELETRTPDVRLSELDYEIWDFFQNQNPVAIKRELVQIKLYSGFPEWKIHYVYNEFFWNFSSTRKSVPIFWPQCNVHIFVIERPTPPPIYWMIAPVRRFMCLLKQLTCVLTRMIVTNEWIANMHLIGSTSPVNTHCLCLQRADRKWKIYQS